MNNTRPSRRFSTILISAFFIFMVGILIVMSIVFYYYSYDNMRSRTITDTKMILEQAGKNIGRYITNIEGVSVFINTNKDLNQYLSGQYKSEQEAARLRTNYENILSYVPELANGIVSVFVFDRQNEAVYKPTGLEIKPNFDITKEGWYKQAAAHLPGQPQITGTHVRTMTKKVNPWVVSMSSNIAGEDGSIVGMQLIELDYRAIEEIVSDINLGSRGYVFIVDSSGNIVYHPQLQLIYSGLKHENIEAILQNKQSTLELPEENKLYNITKVPGTDFSMVGVAFLDEIVGAAREMILIYIILVLIMAFIAFIGAVQISTYVTKPLSKLERAVNQVEQGNLDADFNIKGTYETERFAASLGSMVDTIKQLMKQIVKGQEVIRTSEIRALQAQINPHFLYNTLDSIVWIAEDAGNEKIKEITVALANYFKIVLSSGKDIIHVETEVAHVRNYLVIQKMRYEELDYSIEIEDQILRLSMPKLLLQPIIENAIYHGIKNNIDSGTIWMRGYLREDKLIFEVEDNGRGMRPHEVQTILSRSSSHKVKHGSVGMRNIQERIRLYFGDEYGLKVESVYRQGTKVTITLPACDTLQET